MAQHTIAWDPKTGSYVEAFVREDGSYTPVKTGAIHPGISNGLIQCRSIAQTYGAPFVSVISRGKMAPLLRA